MRTIIEALQNVSSGIKELRRVTLSLLEKDNGAKICDFGCANGEFTVEVAEAIGATEVIGVDLSQENLNRASEKGIITIKADLNRSLPFDDETFDVIHASQVIEHLYNTDFFVKEIYSVEEEEVRCNFHAKSGCYP